MTEQRNRRLINLDFLRLASALLVVLFHYGFRMGNTNEGGGVAFPELATLAMWSDAGLLLFFAISGFVIAHSVEGRSATDFAVGRIARLWPSFVVCASATAVVLTIWPVPNLPVPSVTQWLTHFAIVSRAFGQPFLDGAYWTIVYEIIFYGWIFLLVATRRFEHGWRPAVAIWLLLSGLNEFFLDSGALRKIFITEYSGYFAFGLIFRKMQHDKKLPTVILLLAAAFWAGITPLLTEPRFAETYGVVRSAVGVAFSGPLVLVVMMLTVILPSMPVRASFAVALGSLTYPLYLLHQNIGYAVFTHFADTENRFFVLLILLSALFVASWFIARSIEPAGRAAVNRASAAILPVGLGAGVRAH